MKEQELLIKTSSRDILDEMSFEELGNSIEERRSHYVNADYSFENRAKTVVLELLDADGKVLKGVLESAVFEETTLNEDFESLVLRGTLLSVVDERSREEELRKISDDLELKMKGISSAGIVKLRNEIVYNSFLEMQELNKDKQSNKLMSKGEFDEVFGEAQEIVNIQLRTIDNELERRGEVFKF